MASSKPQKGINDLETMFPEIAKEADGWDPTTVRFGSHKKMPWKCTAPALCKRLVDIGLSERTRPYTSVDAIKTALAFLQSGVIDRENKAEMRKLFRQIEKLEGQPQAIDI